MNSTRMHVLLVSLFFALGAFGPKAQAGAVLELIPQNTGPYIGGESLTVDVWLHNEEAWDHQLRLVQLDFTDSDAALGVSPTFTFDLTSSSAPDDFEVQPDLPIPWTRNPLDYGCRPCRLQLPGNGSLHVGSMAVLLPTDPGAYLLDTVNADDADPYHGARVLVVGGAFWGAYTGEITGGVYDFQVIPEPATLSLLMLGAAGVFCRR